MKQAGFERALGKAVYKVLAWYDVTAEGAMRASTSEYLEGHGVTASLWEKIAVVLYEKEKAQ
jgi:anti-sigma regulatory factor (Ser/Thr protein kinase)